MSGMVLTQLLNPDAGIDRPAIDKAADVADQGRSERGPSRYDDVVREQEKRLEQRRARERADQQKQQESVSQDKIGAAKVPTDRAEGKPEKAASERRTESDNTAPPADKSAEGTTDTETVAAPQEGDNPGTEATAEPLVPLEPFDALNVADGDEVGMMGLALQGASPESQPLAPQHQSVRSPVQVMASLTGTGEKPGGMPTAGALFAAMLEAGQETGKQGSERLAGLQGGNLQSMADPANKAGDTLMAQVTSRLSAPEMSSPQNQAASLRGMDAQALMRNYSTSVDVPVGGDEWGEKVMGKLAWLTASQMQVAEIHITPPDMGPLEVRVQVQNDQAAVTVHAATPAVREQLELHGHRLRDMLSEQGLSLEGFDVSDSPGREAADQQGDDDESGDGRSGQTLAGGDAASESDVMATGELDLSWKGELDLYA